MALGRKAGWPAGALFFAASAGSYARLWVTRSRARANPASPDAPDSEGASEAHGPCRFRASQGAFRLFAVGGRGPDRGAGVALPKLPDAGGGGHRQRQSVRRAGIRRGGCGGGRPAGHRRAAGRRRGARHARPARGGARPAAAAGAERNGLPEPAGPGEPVPSGGLARHGALRDLGAARGLRGGPDRAQRRPPGAGRARARRGPAGARPQPAGAPRRAVSGPALCRGDAPWRPGGGGRRAARPRLGARSAAGGHQRCAFRARGGL